MPASPGRFRSRTLFRCHGDVGRHGISSRLGRCSRFRTFPGIAFSRHGGVGGHRGGVGRFRGRRHFASSIGRGLITRHTLQIGELAVLEFEQPLQGLHLILQVLQTTVQLRVLATSAFQFFHHHRSAGIDAPRKLAVPAGGAAFLGITATRVVRDQQFEFGLPPGRRGGCRSGATGGGGINRAAGRFECLILPGHLAHSFGPTAPLDVFKGGNPKHFAPFQAVDIAAHESIGIQVLYRQHDLLHGYTVVRTHPGGDGPKGIGRPGRADGGTAIAG